MAGIASQARPPRSQLPELSAAIGTVILIPDAVFEDDHVAERAAAAPQQLVVRRARNPLDVPDEDWQNAEAVIAYHRIAYDDVLCKRLTRCRILVRVGVGCDNVDLAAFAARGMPVCNVPDYGVGEVADHATALLLALTRGIVTFHNAVAADPVRGWDWQRWPPPVRRLRGQRLLIIGFGRIGQAVARRAEAFDLAVGYYDPFRRGDKVRSSVASCGDLDEALGEADIVSLHAPLTPVTRNLIDRRRIAAMKPGAILINTARGGLVDLDALAEGLQTGQIGAAGLDVLPDEPPDPAHPLFAALRQDAPWTRGRLILTPHAAFLSADAIADMRRKAIETAVAYLRDGTLRHCVNCELLSAGMRLGT
jgi:lactate dehydrogenase-like 2-hydroxyacid dehydrogenase